MAAWLQFAALRAIATFLDLLPVEPALALGRIAGRLAWTLDARHRRVALENVRMALGSSLTAEEVRRTGRAAFEHLGMVFVELMKHPRLLATRTAWRAFEYHGLERLRSAVPPGQGVVFVTAHVGNWEVIGLAMALVGYPMTVVVRPLDHPLLDAELERRRSAHGQSVVAKEGAMREVLRSLRSGRHVAFLVDQNQRHDGVFVDFFGRAASTVRSVAALALRTGAPIVVGYTRRLGHRFRHRVEVGEPLWPEATADRDEDVRRLTAEFTRRLEAYIRVCPEQYFWAHRRWRTRPPGEEARPAVGTLVGDREVPA
ncbi:MAG: lysophospholipid acyltransferase family protein [Planctomycetes bacterium]|nr:lysophospholipid acyltransferase family protein [Planctomycetota bacterium]